MIGEEKTHIPFQANKFRFSGKSIRLIDNYIQDFFNNGEVVIKDHRNHKIAHKNLFERFMKRLHFEHGSFFSSTKYTVKIDKAKHKVWVEEK